MNLQQQQLSENVQSREEREFWSSKNIFNNALEMMKSSKNESLAEEKLGFASYFGGTNSNRYFGVRV